jgi:hypothetical protein
VSGRKDEIGGSRPKPSRGREAALWLLFMVALLVIGFTLQDELGIPFDTTFRVACVGMCLFLISKIAAEYPGERWPWISFGIALVVDIAIFFTPLVDRPTSRGELMLFAAPDAVIVLIVRIATYNADTSDQRALRMHMIGGLVLAIVLCVFLFFMMLIGPHTAR